MLAANMRYQIPCLNKLLGYLQKPLVMMENRSRRNQTQPKNTEGKKITIEIQ